MKTLRCLLLAALPVACAAPADAREAQAKPAPVTEPAVPAQGKPAKAALAGEYELGGVMETGSGLLLRGDGSFAAWRTPSRG